MTRGGAGEQRASQMAVEWCHQLVRDRALTCAAASRATDSCRPGCDRPRVRKDCRERSGLRKLIRRSASYLRTIGYVGRTSVLLAAVDRAQFRPMMGGDVKEMMSDLHG